MGCTTQRFGSLDAIVVRILSYLLLLMFVSHDMPSCRRGWWFRYVHQLMILVNLFVNIHDQWQMEPNPY